MAQTLICDYIFLSLIQIIIIEQFEKYYLPKDNTINIFKKDVEKFKLVWHHFSQEKFNCVLVNLYRNGQDSNGWHADNEPELGINPVIASLSLGATRRFNLRHNLSNKKISIDLTNGSLLLMKGEMQHFWKHQLAKSTKVVNGRINLTFRRIQ